MPKHSLPPQEQILSYMGRFTNCPYGTPEKEQRFDLGGAVITSLLLDNLKKANDPSPFPALTQLEVWGTNVCD